MDMDIRITVKDAETLRVETSTGWLVDGGLGPDSLALGDGRVSLGPVCQRGPGVYEMYVSSEVGVYVLDAPHTEDVFPIDVVLDDVAPYACLVEDETADEQLESLRVGVEECLVFASECPGLDEQLRTAAREDLDEGRGQRVRRLAAWHLEPVVADPGCGCALPGVDGPVRVPTERLADAVERITGERPRNEVQVRSLLRRWAVASR